MPKDMVQQSADEPWYLAQLKPGGLERAVANLARQGFQSFMPLREETRRRAGRWERRSRPLFPGYLFVQVPSNHRHWRSINSTYGVSRLVALEAGAPTQVAPSIISGLKERVTAEGVLQPPAELKAGDQVRVVSGPFSKMIAEIESVSEQGRIYVLLNLMGSYAKAQLSSSDVETI